MSISVARRFLVRIAVMLVALFGAGTLSVVTAQTASAANCSTLAHVYINGGHFKWEFDPLNGPVDSLLVLEGDAILLGGNGMTPDEDPFWNIHRESDGQYIQTIIGNRAGDNCVSNEKLFFASGSGTYIAYAFYYRGINGGTVEAQQHFRITVLPRV